MNEKTVFIGLLIVVAILLPVVAYLCINTIRIARFLHKNGFRYKRYIPDVHPLYFYDAWVNEKTGQEIRNIARSYKEIVLEVENYNGR